MGSLQVSTDAWPVVKICVEAEQTDSGVEAFIKDMERVLDRQEKYIALVHANGFTPKMDHIKQLASWQTKTAGRMKELCGGFALVIQSEILRFSFSSFLLLAPLPFPYVITKSQEEAEEWLENAAKEIDIKI